MVCSAIPAKNSFTSCRGAVDVHTEHYEPVRLEVGDSLYLDSQMAHAYVLGEPGRCGNSHGLAQPQPVYQQRGHASGGGTPGPEGLAGGVHQLTQLLG